MQRLFNNSVPVSNNKTHYFTKFYFGCISALNCVGLPPPILGEQSPILCLLRKNCHIRLHHRDRKIKRDSEFKALIFM